jgi:putative ABC transport system permease protein
VQFVASLVLIIAASFMYLQNRIEDIAWALPLIGSADQYQGWGRQYIDRHISFQCLQVGTAFLQVMNIPVVEGRDFREDDKNSEHGKYIFNETARKQFDLELNTDIDND